MLQPRPNEAVTSSEEPEAKLLLLGPELPTCGLSQWYVLNARHLELGFQDVVPGCVMSKNGWTKKCGSSWDEASRALAVVNVLFRLLGNVFGGWRSTRV